MGSIASTTSSVKAIFALDIITAALAFILFLIALSLVFLRLRNNRAWRDTNLQRTLNGEAPLKSSIWTHFFLIPAFFCLSVAYATLAGVVGRQVGLDSSVSVTPPFSYRYDGSSGAAGSGRTVSALSYTNALATVFTSVGLTGAVWLHSVNLKSNGTGVTSPGMASRLWNAFVLTTMMALGVAAWGLGMSRRNDDIFPTTLQNDLTTRALYIAYRVWVIFSSTSVTIQVIANYRALKSGGRPGVPFNLTNDASKLTLQNFERPVLTRFTFVVVPIIWLRNALTILDIVLLHVNTTSWSRTTDRAVAFLLIIFGQIANLVILAMVLYGAWRIGKSAGRGQKGYRTARSSYESYEA